MRKRLILNLFKIVGLLGLFSLEWHSRSAHPIPGSSGITATPDQESIAFAKQQLSSSLEALCPAFSYFAALTPNTSPSKVNCTALPFASAQLAYMTAEIPRIMRRAREDVSDPIRLCRDRSNAYLKLSLHQVDPAFRGCAAELLKRTQVPIILPPTVPENLDRRPLHAYLYLPSVKVDRYHIGLTWKPGDQYQYQANRAYFSGEKLNSDSPTLWEAYEKEAEWSRQSPFFDRKNTGLVSLSQEIEGYYIPALCGVNCHSAYSRVIWDQQGYRYKIKIKMGKKAEVVEVVNAAIENQLDLSSEQEDDQIQS